MRRALLALAFAGCAAPVSPADVQSVDTALDTRVDALAADVVDAARVDATVDAEIDSAPGADTVDTITATDASDATASVDASAADIVDTVTVPDVYDAPVDVPAPDAGPTTYDLQAQYSSAEFHGAIRYTCDPGTPSCAPTYDQTQVSPSEFGRPTGCSFVSGRVSFTVWMCDPFGCSEPNGYVYPSADAGTDFVTFDTAASNADSVNVTRGLRYGPTGSRRQNFHVQFSRVATPTLRGVSGIPGVTVAPEFADIWLLGCPLQ